MRLVRVTAAVIVGAGVLAGCSGGETANETLPSASSTAAETTAALPPLGPPDLPMPDAAREQTPAGAEAFLSYYFQLMNESTVGLNTVALRSLSSDCATCLKFTDAIDAVAAADQAIQGASFVLEKASAPILGSATAEFTLSLTQRSSRLLSPDGGPLTGYDQAETAYPASGALLQWNDALHSWQMSELTFQ